MNKYKYTGTVIVSLQGVGEVKEGQVIETDHEINHPDFELVQPEKEKKGKEK